jgi:hypothetical protein
VISHRFGPRRLAAALPKLKAFFAQLLRQVAATKATTGRRTPREKVVDYLRR